MPVHFARSTEAAAQKINEVRPLIEVEGNESPCQTKDFRPRLSEVGFSLPRQRGLRTSSLSFAVSDSISLRIGKAISATNFDSEKSVAASLKKTKLCLESARPSEAGLPWTTPVSTCATEPMGKRPIERKQKVRIRENSRDSKLDLAINSDQLVILKFKSSSNTGTDYGAILARRFDLKKGRCEYLVNYYEGPICSKEGCEDGAEWWTYETISKAASDWSVIQ